MQTVAAFLCCAALLGVAHSQVDLTLVPEANGTVVVQACLAKITGANIFAADNQMLRRIAYVETRDGTDSDTYTPTNNGGIWQLSESKYMQTKGSSSGAHSTSEQHQQLVWNHLVNYPVGGSPQTTLLSSCCKTISPPHINQHSTSYQHQWTSIILGEPVHV